MEINRKEVSDVGTTSTGAEALRSKATYEQLEMAVHQLSAKVRELQSENAMKRIDMLFTIALNPKKFNNPELHGKAVNEIRAALFGVEEEVGEILSPEHEPNVE